MLSSSRDPPETGQLIFRSTEYRQKATDCTVPPGRRYQYISYAATSCLFSTGAPPPVPCTLPPAPVTPAAAFSVVLPQAVPPAPPPASSVVLHKPVPPTPPSVAAAPVVPTPERQPPPSCLSIDEMMRLKTVVRLV